jgi:DNA invertase Pin-like site-specific DNA recombinase
MPRTCTICSHEDRPEIERALVHGEPFRNVAIRFGTSVSSLHRHKNSHLAPHLAKAFEAANVTRAEELVQESEVRRARDLGAALDVAAQLRAINAACLEILQKSRSDGKHTISLGAIDRIHRQLELQSRLLGELQEAGPTVNVLVAPEWREIRVNVLQALGPYPEARSAVARVLGETSNGR